MILTGSAIKNAYKNGDITLSPFDEEQINPNSYNYRLGKILKVYDKTVNGLPVFKDIVLQKEGYVLKPHTLYLGHTKEVIGSKKYAMSLIGRSSMGRLGLFLQVSANLGHTKSCHQWTLELVAAMPIRLYPEMIIGQVTFWDNCGFFYDHPFTYGKFNCPTQQIKVERI